MGYVRAKDNPIVINESLMGKILKNTPDFSGNPLKKYNPTIIDAKNKKVIKGKDAKQMIEDIDNGSFINVDKSVHGKPKENKELKDKFKDAKTVKFKEVKPPKEKKTKETPEQSLMKYLDKSKEFWGK